VLFHLPPITNFFTSQANYAEFLNIEGKKYLSRSLGDISKNSAIASASGILIA